MRRPSLTPEQYQRITAGALVALTAIIVTGAAVRLTGSGLGCPEWPTCERGSIVPRGATGAHGVIEFVNRTITGVVSITVILAVLGSRWRRPRRRDLTLLSWGLVLGVLAQAVLGGIVVLADLAPVSVIGHFLLSMVLVWNAVVLHDRAGSDHLGRRPIATTEVLTAGRLLIVAAVLTIVTGTVVTASGPHGGDEAAERLDLVVGDVARLHGIAMVLFLALTVSVLVMIRRGAAAASVERRGRELLVVLVVQAAVGYTQYFTGVPAFLVGIHVLGAALVWIAVLRFALGLREPVPADGTAAAAPGLASVTP